MIRSFGDSALPVAQAGQTSWQRPHSVHENVSMHLLPGQVVERAGAEAQLLVGALLVEAQRLEPPARRACVRSTR